jgi:hypothetical protein
MTEPVAVVLDHMELLDNQECLDAVASWLRSGSTSWPWTSGRPGRCWRVPGLGWPTRRRPSWSGGPRGGRSGPLCDAVLDTEGSDRVLSSLEDSNLLLVALDRRRKWYRYHHLFGELLRAQLERREPELIQQLHARAAAWWEANGLPELAIDHAQAAGDADRVARLVASLAQPAYAAGRVDTARRWLAWFEDQGLVEQYPPVTTLGAWLQALVGQPARAERWADAAERPVVAADRTPVERTRQTAARPKAIWRCCAGCCAATAWPGCGPTPRLPWPG